MQFRQRKKQPRLTPVLYSGVRWLLRDEMPRKRKTAIPPRKPRETPIEQMFRKYMGRKMTSAERRYLLKS